MELEDRQTPDPGPIERYIIYTRAIGLPGSNLSYMGIFRAFQHPGIPGRDYIRLLHLYPGDYDSSRLYGDLRVHKLDAQCEYEAISYSWGDYPKAYRYHDRPRVLWADAICINQEDTAEKAQQVAIMASIYSKAKEVQVWLAPDSPKMTDAIQFMADLSLRAGSFGTSDEINEWDEIPSIDIPHEKAESLIHDAIQAHVDILFFRSWFNRVWVVQEAALATELVLSCGLSRIDWNSFSIAAKILRGAFKQLSQGTKNQKMQGIKPAWALIWYRHDFRMLNRCRNTNYHSMTVAAGRLMSNRDCSDDRDRIYAMLALTTSPYPVTPNYSKTVAEVYTEFARRYSPNTHIFQAGLCRRQRLDRNHQAVPIDISDQNYLPSWVPEFRPSLNLAWASSFGGEYSAATAALCFFRGHAEMLSVMHVGGTIFDIVYITTWEYTDKRNAAHLALELGFYFSLLNQLQHILTPPPQSRRGIETLLGASGAEFLLSRYAHFQSLTMLKAGSLPWLTAIWDRFETHCLSPTGEVFQYILLQTLGGKPKPLSTDGTVALGFLIYVANILLTNKLFVTRGNYLGLAPRDIRGGDFIAVFNGLPLPYVVRAAGKVKYKDSAQNNERTTDYDMFKSGALQVIGPCYLHGIMNGEIFTNRGASQFSHLDWTRLLKCNDLVGFL
ncbi:heterokaryon incompatibility protein-domain-containing protein [Xylaria arbuscula]|nr:heterokaryon incompatibility protein-domain-containing protein [Xylaria arbuscula]